MSHTASALVAEELESHTRTLNFIAAANRLSPGVVRAMDPGLGQVHVEGYPGERYHQGLERIDQLERRAAGIARELFGFPHANVQASRGTLANTAAALAVCEPGDVILGLECRAGGHYSTSTDVGLIGRLFSVHTYGLLPESHAIDYESLEREALRLQARAIFCGDTAYPGAWDLLRLREIADRAGAVLIGDLSQTIGLVAAGYLHDDLSPLDIVTAATYKTLRGPRGTSLILTRDEFAGAVDRAVTPVCQGGTDATKIAGLCAALEAASTEAFGRYGRQVLANARALAQALTGHGFRLVTGGTENHAVLLDLSDHALNGHEIAIRLATCGIICNGNQIPFEDGTPRAPRGLRLGTPLTTSLGFLERDTVAFADLFAEAMACLDDPDAVAALQPRVLALRRRFPG